MPFLSIFLRDVYFIKVRSQDVIKSDDGIEELNLKVAVFSFLIKFF